MLVVLTIISYIFVVLSAHFLYQLIACFVPERAHVLCKILSHIVLFFIVAIAVHPNDLLLNMLFLFTLFLFMMLFLFEGTFIQKISVVFILFPTILSINFLIEDIGLQFWELGGKGELLDRILHILFFLFRAISWRLIYKSLGKYVTNCRTFLTTKMWLIINIICLAPLVAMCSLLLFTPSQSTYIYPASFACIITSLGNIYLTGYISETIKTTLENQNLQLRQTYYEELENNQHEIRKLRHDMNNHLSVIGTLLNDNDKEKTESYFQQLSLQLLSTGRTFCTNSIVNAVINAKYNLIVQHEIDTFFNIEIDHLLTIDDISLCSIFANTLDNAIEASLQVMDTTKRKITLKARYYNNYFSYEITNTKENQIEKKNNAFLTTKKNHRMHGFGLGNIAEIVKQYNGTLDISHSENEFSVIILIS